MKRPWLIAALVLVVISNAWVLIHVARNRSGSADAELELTERELPYVGGRREESVVVLTLRWQNTAPEYLVTGMDWPGWFDRKKLEELGFDLEVPADAKEAPRYYQNQRSREVFVALEFDGAAWPQLLRVRERGFQLETRYNPQMSVEQRLDVARQTESRLVAVDAAHDPIALRQKYPDRRRVMLLPGLARATREDARPASADDPGHPAGLRGAITKLTIEEINVPVPLNRLFDSRSPYSPLSYEGRGLKIHPPTYAATLRVGSLFEPWLADVRPLR